MKLREGFITYQTESEYVIVAVGDAAAKFHGMVRCNAKAAFIIETLKSETTRDLLIEAVVNAEENAPVDLVSKDVDNVLATLRKIGALDE